MKKLMLSTLAAASLFAADQFEIGALFNNNYYGTVVKDNQKSWGVRANYRVLDNILVGLEYDKACDAKYSTGTKSDLQSYFLNAIYEVNPDNSIVPYAIAGIGYQDIDQEIANRFESGMLAQVGAGWKFKLIDFLNLFVEGRYIRDFENSANNFALTGGLSIPFGESAPKAAPATPKDSDHDGVPDNVDECPNTPFGISVDKAGCPLDSDQDGIPDSIDECPNTPFGVDVDAKGCKVEHDSDGDGVVDSLDKCPNTPKGVAVDKAGCPIVFNLQINFDFDSAKVKPEYLPKIKEVVEFLKAHPAYKAEIQGHTDNIGSAAYNKKLSERRAKAVYDIMVKMGIDPKRLSYVGYGEERPIADNATPEGRAKNRRVEVHILY